MAALRESVDETKNPLEIRAHEHSALAGAIGAAIWGAFRARKVEKLGASLASTGAGAGAGAGAGIGIGAGA
jgi:hypothetical protein